MNHAVDRSHSRLVSACVVVATLLAFAAATPSSAAPRAKVIVRGTSAVAAEQAVERAGGSVGLHLPIVSGVSASVPATALDALGRAPGVLSVTPDEQVHVAGHDDDEDYPSGVKSVFNREINADLLWPAGIDGRGVRVALIDTGIAPLLDFGNRVIDVPHPSEPGATAGCVNFTSETNCNDSYGHGTFVAGLIAGDGSSSRGRYRGVAPKAELVSVKIAGASGAADVSKVLAAIQWVVSFRDLLNIRVLNLSLGTNSPVSYTLDPLNFAVERAWRAGIAVVVSAGNLGPDARTISKPADDPYVITTGAVDDRETPAIDDDRLPAFSARGPTKTDGLAKPDIVAPGGKLVSLQAPDSTISNSVPTSMRAPYRRGSGTSMSAGVVSGAAALLIQARPLWTPDRIKFALASTARKVASRDVNGVGAGLIDVAGALAAGPGLANQNVRDLSDATGLLDGSRGDVFESAECLPGEQAIDPQCDRIHGEEIARNKADFDRKEFTAPWDGSSWYGSQWAERTPLLGSSWYGSSWYGSSWYGSSWYGSSWYGSEDSTSYGTPLLGSSWYGAWE